jgi:2-polyprenyl-6-methoxyphenol hydroxylase-like FAD-dependent oxidoreductase
MPDRAAGANDGRQVLVVGDGVGGLSAAAFLHRQGLDPTVVAGPPGRSTDREVVERCVTLWDTAVGLLADIGVTAELAPSSVEVGTWVVSTADGTVLERLEAPDRAAHPFLTVDRRRLRRALRDRLPSRSVRLTKTPRALRTDDGPPAVEFEDGVRERFDLVVGADGTDSWVGANGFDADRPTADGTTTWAFRADDAGVPGTVAEAWGTDAMVAVVPVASGACGRLVTTADDPRAAADALAGAFGHADNPVTGGLDLPAPDALVGGPGYVHRADPWAADRLALVGDAAHTLPPCSLGPSLAVEDGYVLADELSDRTGTAAALGRYECRRRGRLHRLDDRAGPDGAARHPLSAAGLPDLLELRLALLRSSFARRAGTPELSPAERI